MPTEIAPPEQIVLQNLSRQLRLQYAGGEEFALPYEYLRVFSPSAEVQGHHPSERIWPKNKQNVLITGVHPVGQYALLLAFDDGHNSGIYTWKYLWELAQNFAVNWAKFQSEIS